MYKQKKHGLVYILALLLLLSTFLTHFGHGNAANFSVGHENYWQLVVTPARLLPFILLLLFLLLALFLQVKQLNGMAALFVLLALAVHTAILLSAASPLVSAFSQGTLLPAFGLFVRYAWGLLIDLALTVFLLVVFVNQNINKKA